MSKKILNCISYLSKEYHSKSALWYRNYLCRKNNINQKTKINKLNINELDKRFYYTYLSEIVCDEKIDINEFIEEKNKKLKYYKYYETFDHEYGGRTRLYGIEKIETNHLFKHEKRKHL